MKVYISGQITGLSESQYKQNFKNAYSSLFERKIVDCSLYVVNPLKIKPFLGIKCWLCYMITDIFALRKCTHIAMQPNWKDSKGAVIEYFLAKFIFKLDVIFL